MRENPPFILSRFWSSLPWMESTTNTTPSPAPLGNNNMAQSAPFSLSLFLVLHTSEDLVEEHFDMIRGQVLGRDDDLVEVALHQLRNDVSVRRGEEEEKREGDENALVENNKG